MSGEWSFVWASYLVTWITLAVYWLSLGRRAAEARRALEEPMDVVRGTATLSRGYRPGGETEEPVGPGRAGEERQV